jgi:hypothetical protein
MANAVAERVSAEVPAAQSETDETLLMIARAARDPQVDIDKFERLMAWKERIETRAKEEAFNAAMSAAQHEMPAVIRDRTNEHTRSRYATLEAIAAAIAPVYTKHGFSLSFGSESSAIPNHYRVTCIASCGGHSRTYSVDLPADAAGSQGKVNKTPIQAFGSTMSYGRRYLTCLIFNVAIKDEDDDGDAGALGERITEDQLIELDSAIVDIAAAGGFDEKATRKNFCDTLKVKSLADLPAGRFAEAQALLNQKKRRAAK